MSLIFYYAPMSTASITQLVIEELGVPCERVLIDLKAGGSHTAEFLKLNPNGKVPMIVHDGVPIWESAAVTLYLGETFGVEKGLFPAPGPKRGEAMKWVVWSNVSLGDAVARWLRNTSEWTPADQHNEKAAEAGHAEMRSCLAILNAALTGKPFLLGDYSVVDTHLNSYIDWLRYMKVDLGAYPNVIAWGERCAARPAYAKVMHAS